MSQYEGAGASWSKILRPAKLRAAKNATLAGGLADGLVQQLMERAHELLRQYARELYLDLVDKCPKETGRLAAGFIISQGPTDWTPPLGDYRGSLNALKAENLARLAAIPVGSEICISNNVEYLDFVEYGDSRTLPVAFIAIAEHSHAARYNWAVSSLKSTVNSLKSGSSLKNARR